MRSQVFFSMLAVVMTLCVAPTIAAPASDRDLTLAQRGMFTLSRRVSSVSETTVCDVVKIRGEAKCDGKKVPLSSKQHLARGLFSRMPTTKHGHSDSTGSEYKPPSEGSTASEETDDSDAGDPLQCDHAVELQLLDTYTKNAKFCDALHELLHIIHKGATITATELTPSIDPLKSKINVDKNFYPIPSKWNTRKRDFTISYKKGSAATAPDSGEKLQISKKVALYVKATSPYPVETNMKNVGKDLDEEMKKSFDELKRKAQGVDKAAADKVTWTPPKTMEKYVEEYITYIENAADLPLKH